MTSDSTKLVIPWYLWGAGSRTLADPEPVATQVPCIKWCRTMHTGGPPQPQTPICGWKILFSIPSCLIQQMQNPGILRANWGTVYLSKKKSAYDWTHVVQTVLFKGQLYYYPHLQMRRLKFRKVTYLTHSHKAHEWQCWNWNSALSHFKNKTTEFYCCQSQKVRPQRQRVYPVYASNRKLPTSRQSW